MTACSTTCMHMTDWNDMLPSMFAHIPLTQVQLDMFDMYCCAHHCLKTLFWEKEKGLTFFEIASCDLSHPCQSLQVRLPVHMTKSFVGASFAIGPRAPCKALLWKLNKRTLGKQGFTHTPSHLGEVSNCKQQVPNSLSSQP